MVTFPVPTAMRGKQVVVATSSNDEVGAQVVSDGTAAIAEIELPSVGFVNATMKATEKPVSPPSPEIIRELENDFYQLRFSESGFIESLVLKED